MRPRHAGSSVKRRRVIFAYDDSQAREVTVSGDFNAWNQSSHPMKKNSDGCWQKIMMLCWCLKDIIRLLAHMVTTLTT